MDIMDQFWRIDGRNGYVADAIIHLHNEKVIAKRDEERARLGGCDCSW